MTKGTVLLVGETWVTYGIHQKGFSAYTTGDYNVGSDEFIAALRSRGWEVEHIPNHLATQQFPWNERALDSYDAVIFSDMPADTLLLHSDSFVKGQRTPNRLKLINDWVHSGGGFLMVGGYMSFSGFEGKAGFHGSHVERCLPVEMLGYDDRMECPEGVTPRVVADHPITRDLPMEWPHFLGYNRVRAKSADLVLLTIEGDPMLAVAERGTGRSAAFMSDCSPHWGSPEFMGWQGYAPFWDHLLSWLARK